MGWMLRGVADGDRAFVGGDAIRRELATKSSRWATVGDRRRLAGVGHAAPRRRPAAAQGRAPAALRVDAVRRPTTAGGRRSATSPASCTPPCCSGTSAWPGCVPTLAAPGTEVHMELAINHQHDGAGPHGAAAPVQPREEDGEAMSPDTSTMRTTPSWSAAATTGWSTPPTSPRPACAPSCSSSATSSAARRSPRSCSPGFSFTTFSYALSLLRPEIIHELDLVEHGFMPLMMPSSFHPTGDGDYLLLGDDHDQNIQEIRRHSRARRRRLRPLPPRPRPGRARRSGRCSTTRRPTSSARTPRTRPTSPGCSTTSAASSRR